MTFPLFWK